MISSEQLAKQLSFTHDYNDTEDIYEKKLNYDDTVRIILNKNTFEVTKTVYAFPRIDRINLSDEEQKMIHIRIQELKQKGLKHNE